MTPTSLLQLLTFVYLVLGWQSPSVMAQWQSQSSMNSNSGNGVNCNTQTSSYIRNGQKIQTVLLRGCGINDYFEFEVPMSASGVSVTNSDNCLIIADPGVESFFIFSEEPNTLTIKRDGACTRKTYTTNRNGQVTSTSSPLSNEDCQRVTLRIREEQEKNKKHWEDWNRNFQQEMQQKFPPGFPFRKPYQSANDYSDEGNSYSSASSQSGNLFGGITTMASGFAQIGGNIAQKVVGNMKKVFPPGFPFN